MLPKLPPLPQTSLPPDLQIAAELAAELEVVLGITTRHLLPVVEDDPLARAVTMELAPVFVRVYVLSYRLAYRISLAARAGAEVTYRSVHGPGKTM